MREQFVGYEISLALKELGFNEKCFGYYSDCELRGSNIWYRKIGGFHVAKNNEITSDEHVIIIAPLYQQVLDWFMKEHNMFINIFQWGVKYYLNDELQTPRFLFDMETYGGYTDDFIYQSINDELKYESFYEAREQSILKAIEIIKNK